MSPRIVRNRACKKNVPETKKISPKKPLPKKAKSKPRAMQKTPKNKKMAESVPTTSVANPTKKKAEPMPSTSRAAPIEDNENKKKEDISVTPKVMKYYLNAYKDSPEYENLRKKRFNTGFSFECKRRGSQKIEIFTPEEDNSPKWRENLPSIEQKIKGPPGETYANIFMSIPGLSDSGEDEQIEPEQVVETKSKGKKGKKGRKSSIGYKGVPLTDFQMDYQFTT